MANIKVELSQEIIDGQPVTFVAPCNCNEITGLKVCYPDGSKVFTFKDAHGNALTGLGNLFGKGAYVKAILDVTNGYAYIQNADTNGYLEAELANRLPLSGGKLTGNVQVGAESSGLYAQVLADGSFVTKMGEDFNGGYARGYSAIAPDDSVQCTFGFYGDNGGLNYAYIGTLFGSPWIKFDSTGSYACEQAANRSLLRNTKLVTSETTPSANGEIYWTYE